MTEQQMIDQFHAMYGNFPERARLIKKDRTVLAVNKAAEAIGMETGVRCIDAPGNHAGCAANQALKERCGKSNLSTAGRLRFWVPVEGADDVFVHFSIPGDAFAANGEGDGR